ncbi:MAG TPA: hypothetical protein VE866_02330, partial [Candidatus Binatia bacterium]|nr:hypothetical protein [Candidatus Binatia bacterium]
LDDPVAVPTLRAALAREHEAPKRQFLAAALVRLGDSDPQYFAYVAEAALNAATSDLPFRDRASLDTTSDQVLEQHDEIFAWAQAQAHDVPVLEAFHKATIDLPAAVEALGETADHRSFPILLRGLASPNFFVVRDAAFGMARLHDSRAVGPIVAACSQLPRGQCSLVAKSLL